VTLRHFKSLEHGRKGERRGKNEQGRELLARANSQSIAVDRDTCLSSGAFFYSCFCQTELPPRCRERLRIYSRWCITHLHEPHRRTTRAYRATFKQASHVALTLDILATILGISRYGYRYCALYVSSPGRGDRKTPQDGGRRGGGSEREDSSECASLCLSGGSEP